MTKLEECVRAMYEVFQQSPLANQNFKDVSWPTISEHRENNRAARDIYATGMAEARAVIRCLMEPSEAMRLAGITALVTEIAAQQKRIDEMSPEERQRISSLISGDESAITIEMSEVEYGRHCRKQGALTRNSNETDACFRAMLQAVLDEADTAPQIATSGHNEI